LTNSFLAVGSVFPRTLVLTSEDLLLFDEEYGKWPSLDHPDARKQIPKENQFTLLAREAVSDVTSVVCTSATSFF
jgi:hypothetical protein